MAFVLEKVFVCGAVMCGTPALVGLVVEEAVVGEEWVAVGQGWHVDVLRLHHGRLC